MAQKTHDEWAEEMAEFLAWSEDFDIWNEETLRRALFTARAQVRAWRAEFDKGAPERHKAARRRAAKNKLSTGADVPLWGGE
jgi:methylphosphotriester-DNA--protein-cysteine methyltransferase